MMNSEIRNKYTAIIGLEVHAQLLTESKAYSSDSTEYGSMPNTNISAITLGLPGTLPRINNEVVNKAIKMGIACGSDIERNNIYARKNYFYPDMPKGYQITQDKTPLCTGGEIIIDTDEGDTKGIRITRIHMEEDSGKSMHLDGDVDTKVDFNRAGVALIEIVSDPDIRTSDEAYKYLFEIRKMVRYLEICDGNMEEGSLRCDANISVMLNDAKEFGTKVEVKNMNSFRNVQRAIEHEIVRQIEEVEKGIHIPSETRQFDATNGTTKAMRTKEEMNDYRYFPEPDLPLLKVSEEWIEEMKQEMPPLPRFLKNKFIEDYGLTKYDAINLTDSKEIALFFEKVCEETSNYKGVANWIMGAIKSHLNELTLEITQFPIPTKHIAALINLIDEGLVSNHIAQQKIFPAMLASPNEAPKTIAEQNDWIQDTNEDDLKNTIMEVLERNSVKVQEYKDGNKNLLGMFMGQVMKATGGKADPKKTNQMLAQLLEQ